jgi:hypothetical protein
MASAKTVIVRHAEIRAVVALFVIVGLKVKVLELIEFEAR